MNPSENSIANPMIVLREEFDDWAFLFNPDTSDAAIINPVGVFVWKMLNGDNSINDISAAIKENFSDVPKDILGDLTSFVEELKRLGLASYEK